MAYPFLLPSRRLVWIVLLGASAPGCLGSGSGDPAGEVAPTLATASAWPAFGVPADGNAAAQVRLRLLDAHGRPAANRRAWAAVEGHPATLDSRELRTDSAGFATTYVRSTMAGRATIRFQAGMRDGTRHDLQVTAFVDFVWNFPATYYVRESGRDTDAPGWGTNPHAAWRTLAYAATRVQPGDTVHVGAGVYAGGITFQVSGEPGAPIRILADGDGAFTGDAGEVILEGLVAPHVLRLQDCDHYEIRGFTLRGAFSTDPRAAGLIVQGSHNVLHGLRIYECPAGIAVADGEGNVLEQNVVSNNAHTRGTGIVLLDAPGTMVRNNLVYNNRGAGIHVRGSSVGVALYHNTLYRNAGNQIEILGGACAVTMRDNVLTEGASSGVYIQSGSDFNASNNLVFGHPGSNWNGVAPGPSAIAADALFAAPAGADGLLGGRYGADDSFHLEPNAPSPAIDAGSDTADELELASGLALSELSTHREGLLDGSFPDGPVVNLGYHYPSFRASPDPLAAGDARIFHSHKGRRHPRMRTWIAEQEALTDPVQALSVRGRIRWLQPLLSHAGHREELVASLSDTGSKMVLDLLRWSGSSWTKDWSADGLDPDLAYARTFDLERERLSSDCLIVYSTGDPTPAYRVRERGIWSAERRLPLNDGSGPHPDVNQGTVLWIELEVLPRTNRIALVYADTNDHLVSVVWDGTAWLTETASRLETGLSRNNRVGAVGNRAFDAAYEPRTGRLLVAWARHASPGFWWNTIEPDRKSWGAARHEPGAMEGGTPHFVDLAAQPGGGRVLGAFMKLGGIESLGLAAWDGEGWESGEYEHRVRDSAKRNVGAFPLEICWTASGEEAVCVFAGAARQRLEWLRWTATTGWKVQPDVMIPEKKYTESVVVRALPGGDRLLALLSDSKADLFAALYEDAAWTPLNSSLPLEKNLSTMNSVPFGLATQAP